MNDSNVAVGFSDVNGSVNHAFQWDKGIMFDLNLPVGPSNVAIDVNNSNKIVGWMGIAPGGSFYAEGFLWDNGKVTPLGIPNAATNSEAIAISDNGLICGRYAYPNPVGSGFVRRGLLWKDNEMIDLGVLPGQSRTNPQDVNDAGFVVGYCDTPPPTDSQAFVWHDGQIMALSNLVAPGTSISKVRHAFGINQSGQIAANVVLPGMGQRPALLTPVPPQPGDTNCNWVVDVDDLLNVINAWGPYKSSTGGGSGTPDLTDNQMVDVDDLLLVINNWTTGQ